jgi:hypothetical protein
MSTRPARVGNRAEIEPVFRAELPRERVTAAFRVLTLHVLSPPSPVLTLVGRRVTARVTL